MSNDIYHTPYTYLIKFKPTGQVYYGVRFAKGCSPDDLWETYFTSSKVVKSLIEEHGKDAFDYEIRKTFETADAAREWEVKVLQRMRVVGNDKWLNKNDAIAIESMTGENNPFFGRKHSNQSKKLMSKKKEGNQYHKGYKNSDETKEIMRISALKRPTDSEETRRKKSLAKKGKKPNNYGKPVSAERREKLRIAGLNRKKFPCQYCGRELDKGNLVKHERVCQRLTASFTLASFSSDNGTKPADDK